MPLRLPCKRILLSPGGVLYPYWGSAGLPRPAFIAFVVGPGGQAEERPEELESLDGDEEKRVNEREMVTDEKRSAAGRDVLAPDHLHPVDSMSQGPQESAEGTS